MDFSKPYEKEQYIKFFRHKFLPDDFETLEEELTPEFTPKYIKKANLIGEVPSLDLKILEIHHTSENDPRVSLTKESFRLMENYAFQKVLAIFHSENSKNYRLSLLTYNYELEGKKVKKIISPPRRYSFFLGPDAKLYTPTKMLIEGGKIKDFEDLRQRFSIEVVNKEFFDKYFKFFNELWEAILNQIRSEDKALQKAKESALQILNRLIFVYFIQKKKEWFSFIPDGKNIIDFIVGEYKNHKKDNNTFYEYWLRALFLKTFNRKISELKSFPYREHFPNRIIEILAKMPYLNGGLFEENEYDRLPFEIEDDLIFRIIDFLNTYNFTIIENLPTDIEVAINPEVIGKIYEKFVNLETNPILREKYDREGSTEGVIYTEEDEINFMVKNSLKHYLQNNSSLSLDRIYSFLYDEDFEVKDSEEYELLKQLIEDVKIIDPACGSGSFLIGAVNTLYILHKKLQHFDPEHKYSDYGLKRHIIENNIYGVDVMEWAVKITELRLWLFLIVESDLKPEELKTSPLLPNLSFKIRQGDTLIDSLSENYSYIMERGFSLSNSMKTKIENLKKEKLKFHRSEKDSLKRYEIEQMEKGIFREIINEKKSILKRKKEETERELKSLESPTFFAQENKSDKKEKIKKDITKTINSIENELSVLEKIELLLSKEKKPFVWDIDFVEIFYGREDPGFDIVIGNPPYIRQEDIAPPLEDFTTYSENDWKDKKKNYKESLQKMVVNLWGKEYKPDGKADLYVYFYFKSLFLLNKNGVFSFITSNSWLDVEFGKTLQAFLLEKTKIYGIYDSTIRSFADADINTIIIFTSSPKFKKEETFTHTAKFVLFYQPFSRVLKKELLLEIEKTDVKISNAELTELAENLIVKNEYRIFPVKQKDLYNDGCSDGKYIGNKLGGKFLRAPDIFFTILRKGKGKFVKLGDIYDIFYGIKTGAKDFFSPREEIIREYNLQKYCRKMVSSSKEIENNLIDKTNLSCILIIKEKDIKNDKKLYEYVRKGEKIGFNKRSSLSKQSRWYELLNLKETHFVLLQFYDKRLFVPYSESSVYISNAFWGLKSENNSNIDYIVLNNILYFLICELFGRSNLGEGVLTIYGSDFKKFIVFDPNFVKQGFVVKRKILDIFTELGFDPSKPIREQEPHPLPDRKALDDVVFDAIELTENERKEVYYAVAELVKQRLDKAKSRKKK